MFSCIFTVSMFCGTFLSFYLACFRSVWFESPRLLFSCQTQFFQVTLIVKLFRSHCRHHPYCCCCCCYCSFVSCLVIIMLLNLCSLTPPVASHTSILPKFNTTSTFRLFIFHPSFNIIRLYFANILLCTIYLFFLSS